MSNHGRSISRTYIQNISNLVGKLIDRQESRKDWHYSLPQKALDATIVSVGMDGTTSYLVEDGYRETMSGTISFFDNEGNRVHTIYLAQTPEYGKTTFKHRLGEELEQVKATCTKAHYAAVADGAVDNWIFLDPFVDTSTIDYWHVCEYLTPVSKLVARLENKQKVWLEEARRQLKEDKGAAGKLLTEMGVLKTKRASKSKKEKLQRAITYFTNHQHQMNYPACVEKNLPIGSGITEAACKVIVKQRLCCSGMMWKPIGAQSVLNIRSLNYTDGRWEQFWKQVDKVGT